MYISDIYRNLVSWLSGPTFHLNTFCVLSGKTIRHTFFYQSSKKNNKILNYRERTKLTTIAFPVHILSTVPRWPHTARLMWKATLYRTPHRNDFNCLLSLSGNRFYIQDAQQNSDIRRQVHLIGSTVPKLKFLTMIVIQILLFVGIRSRWLWVRLPLREINSFHFFT